MGSRHERGSQSASEDEVGERESPAVAIAVAISAAAVVVGKTVAAARTAAHRASSCVEESREAERAGTPAAQAEALAAEVSSEGGCSRSRSRSRSKFFFLKSSERKVLKKGATMVKSLSPSVSPPSFLFPPPLSYHAVERRRRGDVVGVGEASARAALVAELRGEMRDLAAAAAARGILEKGRRGHRCGV